MNVELKSGLQATDSKGSYSEYVTGANGFSAVFNIAINRDANCMADWSVKAYVGSDCIIDYTIPESSKKGRTTMHGRVERLYCDFLVNPKRFNQFRAKSILDLPFREIQ